MRPEQNVARSDEETEQPLVLESEIEETTDWAIKSKGVWHLCLWTAQERKLENWTLLEAVNTIMPHIRILPWHEFDAASIRTNICLSNVQARHEVDFQKTKSEMGSDSDSDVSSKLSSALAQGYVAKIFLFTEENGKAANKTEWLIGIKELRVGEYREHATLLESRDRH